jgi:glycosyltransferase involved in cell wall biosynthesis
LSGAAADQIRVALVTFGFWPEIQRGGERIVHDLGVDLARLGHRPRIVTSHPGLPRRSVEDGVPVTRHWRPPEAPLRLRKIEEHLSHLPATYASLLLGSYDVANAFYPTDALAAVRWSERTGRPAVFSHTGSPQRDHVSNRRLRLRVLERATRGSTAVTALSRAARDNIWRWLGVEARLIYPGVDLSAFEPGGERAEHPTIVCAAAADDERKRVPLLLDAFRHVRRQRPDARLVLIRPRDRRLEESLRSGAEGVELVEPGTGAVAELFRSGWVSALASHNEAFGLVLVEALACGTPVVGSRDGGVPEIVDRPEVGRLFDTGDERDLARALLEALELAEVPGTREACRARAEQFSTARTAAGYESLYRELLGRG